MVVIMDHPKHIKAIQEECATLECEFCEYPTKTKTPRCLKAHMRTARFLCQICEYVAKISCAFNQHFKTVHESMLCEYVTKVTSSLKQHVASQHSNMSNYKEEISHSKEESCICHECTGR